MACGPYNRGTGFLPRHLKRMGARSRRLLSSS